MSQYDMVYFLPTNVLSTCVLNVAWHCAKLGRPEAVVQKRVKDVDQKISSDNFFLNASRRGETSPPNNGVGIIIIIIVVDVVAGPAGGPRTDADRDCALHALLLHAEGQRRGGKRAAARSRRRADGTG